MLLLVLWPFKQVIFVTAISLLVLYQLHTRMLLCIPCIPNVFEQRIIKTLSQMDSTLIGYAFSPLFCGVAKNQAYPGCRELLSMPPEISGVDGLLALASLHA